MGAAIVTAPTLDFISKRVSRVLLTVFLLMTASIRLSAQTVAVSPSALTFSKQTVGSTSAAGAVTITNNSGSSQAVTISPSGDFTESDDCGGNIASGGSCNLKVYFAPTIVGNILGASTIRDNSGNLLALLGLAGNGVAPVTVAPASLAFGAVPIGTLSAAKTFKITNNTSGSISITAIAGSSDYVINTGTCLTTAIGSRKSCTVSVQAQPTAALDDGAVVVTGNVPGGTPLVVALSATGSGTVNAPISLSKTSLTFKTAAGGSSAAQSVTVTNTSGSAVTMGAITASSDYNETNSCPALGSSLAAGGSCTISISFAPQFAGKIGGTIAVGFSGSNSPQLVNLSGTSIGALTAAPNSISFGSQAVGSASPGQAIRITNNSASAITLGSIVPSGDFQIQVARTSCSLSGGSLAAGKSCLVELQFAPTVAGAIVGSLTVTNSASPNPLLVALSGATPYAPQAPSATLTPSSAHQGSAQTIVITGTGTTFGPTTTVNFGADITTGTVTVNGPTNASVPITIDNVAATGSRNVTITTGSQVVTTPFTVIAGVPVVTVISPNTIQPTQTESVSITGAFTNWVSGTPQANFGPGISVGGAAAGTFGPVTVNSGTSLTANLVTSGATNGFRTVQIQTSSQTLTVINGIDVKTCGAAPAVLFLSPPSGATSVPLNTQVQAQFSEPMNRNTFSLGNSGSTTVFFYDASTGREVPGTISLDASGTIATITPSQALAAARQYLVYWSYANWVQDACGNNLPSQQYGFVTAFGTNLTGPTLTGTSPENGDTNIPLSNGSSSSTPVVLQFNGQLDPITAQTGFSITTGGIPVSGNFTYSGNDRTVTFTPTSPLPASSTYTVSYTAQIADTVGNPLTNPGSFTFTTGTTSATTGPSVTLADPANNTFNVGLNVTPHITFSEPVNELTIPTALALYYENSSPIVPATVTVAANRLSATITPNAPLLPNTYYQMYICGYSDIAGNNGNCFGDNFYTGASSDSTSATVSTISPANGQTGVPLNGQIVALMSDVIDSTSVTNTSITVTPSGGSAIAGAVTLSSNGLTLTFVPSAALTASTVYNVSVGGFKDIEGNTVTTFTSSFTTGTVAFGSGSFVVNFTSPASGATGVSVTSPVTFTMSNLINPGSANSSTIAVYDSVAGAYVAGSVSVSGNAATFTPLTQYPANTLMYMGVFGLADEAGNADTQYWYTFTTANLVDHNAPTVTITPTNGATNVGLNTQIVLSFSKSINPATISATSLGLFNGNTSISYGYSVSQDNRTVIVNPSGSQLPSGATLTVALTGVIQDLSGNALTPTSSQFTLTTALSGAAPGVIVMRPGNGATNVPANTVVTLFTSAPMNASTVPGALHVSDNGVVVFGTVQLFSSGQGIEFTPAAAFNPGDVIQVFLDSTAQSATGVALSSFSGQFTVAGSPLNLAAAAQTVNPPTGASNVPLNTVLQIEYNQPLLAVTVNNVNVRLYEYITGTYLTPTVSLVGTQVIQIQPTSNLAPNSAYQVCVSGVTNASGVPVQNYCMYFYAGTAADTVAPTVVSVAPANLSTNIGTNAVVSVTLNKAMNPVSVTGSTIQLSGGSVTETPTSISFSPDYTRVTITSQAPLPPSTVMTIAINGVTSEAGVAVASQSPTFTTMAGPDFNAPYVVNASVQNGQLNVPVNSVFSMQFSKPMDIGSFNAVDVNVYGGPSGQVLPATVTWSADRTTIFIVPTSPPYAGTGYRLESYYMTDLSGNPQQNFNIGFTTSFTTNTNPPTVVNTSPENTETLVPTNSPVEVLFSEPIQPTSVGQVTLKTGGNAVAVTPSFGGGNQLLVLTSSLPLSENATYTLTITGVKDTAGNTMTTPVTNTFTTGLTFDLVHPAVVLFDPASNTTGVGTNVLPRVQFSKRVNPLSVVTSSNEGYNGNGSVELIDTATNQWVPVTVSMSADRMTAALTPTSALSPNTQYELYIGCSVTFYDVAGNYGSCSASYFTTGSSTDTAHTTVSTISPVNGQTGVPLNGQIAAAMSDDIDPTTVSNSSITVTPSGGSAIAGTVTLANGASLTFVPSAALTASTVYNVSVGGFKDAEGNTVTTFTSSFITGTVAFGTGSFTVSATTPVSGATGVSVTSPVTFTMTNLINPASANSSTISVYDSVAGAYVAGSVSVSGNAVTFTPLTQYPANTLMYMGVFSLADEAGNVDTQYWYTFTTTNTVDNTPPTMTITPSNGSTNLGLYTQAVLTFSKSINPATINATTVNMLNGDVPLNPSISISHDNRTVVLSVGQLPAGATLTVTASHLITDLSGNALADTTSQFTTTPAVLSSAPSVVSMRPGNGATNVPTSTVITLFTSAPMNAGTIAGAFFVSQNGVPVAGSTTVGSNGRSVEFTPASALTAGTVIQVFLNSTAQDIYGNYLSSFAGSFTTAGSLVNTAAAVQAVNPFPGAIGVPLNSIPQIEYNQALLAVTVNNVNVTLYQYSTSTYLTTTVALVGGGQVIQIQPTAILVSNSQYQACVAGVTNIDGVPVQHYCFNFTAGTSVDLAVPTIVAVAPANSSSNIGTNALVSVTLNKAMNPVSVTGSTIQLSGGSVTETPSSISFSSDYTRVTIVSQAPLPSSTVMTIAISGVTSQAGVPLASQSTTFTTMAGPDFSAPFVSNPSVQNGQTVGTNAVLSMQFNKPMDPGSVNPMGAKDVFVYDYNLGAYVTIAIGFSADLTSIFLTPTANLAASHQFQMCSYSMTDLSGNPQQSYCENFYAGSGTVTTGPSVVQVSPSSGLTGVPQNSPVQILFSEAVDAASLGGVTLKQGSTVIPTTTSLYDGDKGVQLLPLTPLSANTTYTINVTGVLDITGNSQTSFPSQSFTTGSGISLVVPALVSTTPANGATSVAVTTTVQVVFSESMDVAAFDPNNSFELYDAATSSIVPATITFSANNTTATLTPTSNLTGGGVTYYMYIGYITSLYDLAGNRFGGTYITFTTK